MLDRFSLFALLAAKQAVQGSFGALTGRGGVFVGTDMGGTHTMDDGRWTMATGCSMAKNLDRIRPCTIPMGMQVATAD